MDRKTLKAVSKEQIKGKIGILFLISLVIGLIAGVIASIPKIGSIASSVISAPFSLATVVIYLGITEGKKPELKDAFSQFKNFVPAFCTQFLIGLFTFLWSLLLIVPGIIKALSYSQAMYILAENPGISAKEAINKSKEMMEGHKMEYFILNLSFIGWAILGAFTLGILYIWLLPYMNTTFANYYKSLKGEFVTE